jgi:hypothetical protein
MMTLIIITIHDESEAFKFKSVIMMITDNQYYLNQIDHY